MHRAIANLSIVAALSCFCVGVSAQDDAKLPSGKEVLAQCGKVIGKEKIEQVKTMTMKGVAEIPEFAMKGNVVMNYREGEVNVVANFGGAKTIQGVTDSKGWEITPTTGARLMSEVETQQLMSSLTNIYVVAPEKVYKKIENTGKQAVGDEMCYRVKLVRKLDGGEEEMYFSVASGLPIRTVMSKETQFGKVEVVTTLSDFKVFGGIKTPTKSSSQLEALGMSYNMTFESVNYNKPVEDSAFVVPAEIKKLLEK